MSRIKIKESEIRRYVRSLIREAYEVEAVEDPADVAERNKMLAGQPYDRRKFPDWGKSFSVEREYRKKMGYPVLTKPHGGVRPYLIDANGNDVTPENQPDAIAYELERRKRDKNSYNKGRYTKLDHKKYMEQGKLLTGDEQLALSPEELDRYKEGIRKSGIERNMANNAKNREKYNDWKASFERGGRRFTANELVAHIKDLKEKQKALGPHCEENDKKWRNYDYIIKDTQRILNSMYGGEEQTSNDQDDLDFIEDGGTYQGSPEDMDDNFVPFDSIPISVKNDNADDTYEPLDDNGGRRNRRGRMKDAEDMGYFSSDDDFDNMF